MTGVWLGIETTTANGGIALVREGIVVREELFSVLAVHSEKVLPGIDNILRNSGIKKTDISGIAVSTGPGSYTGIRIGIATAVGLATGWNIPVTGVETLRVLGAECASSEPVLVCIGARKKEVYGAVFADSDIDSRVLLPPGIYTSGAIEMAIVEYMPSIAVGNGRSELNCSETLEWLPVKNDTPSPSQVASLGSIAAERHGINGTVTPCYLRKFMEKAKDSVI